MIVALFGIGLRFNNSSIRIGGGEEQKLHFGSCLNKVAHQLLHMSRFFISLKP
jgi:hypothetical protein